MAHLVAETRRYILHLSTYFSPSLTLSTKTIKGTWRITVVPVFLAVPMAVNRRDAQTRSYLFSGVWRSSSPCDGWAHHHHSSRKEGGQTHTDTHTHSFSNQTHIHAHTHTKPSHVSHWFLSWLRTWLTADGTKRRKTREFILQKGKHTLGWGRRPSQMADNIVMPIWWTSPRPNRHNRLLCLRMCFFFFVFFNSYI